VASVYLFGSHVAGRAHRESDVDLGVLLRWDRHAERRGRFEVRVALGSSLASVPGTDEVDVVILNDAPPLLGRRIVWEGRRLFVADPEADRAFVRDIQLQAADLEPFLRREV
jgi:predicted nucleotidyltransferase